MTTAPFEENADLAIAQLHHCINAETRTIDAEHELESKLLSWDYIILHLIDIVPEDSQLTILIGEISDKLLEIRNHVQQNLKAELRLIAEDLKILNRLEQDLAHKNYRLSRAALSQAQKSKRITILELEELLKFFKDLANITTNSENLTFEVAHLTTYQNKIDFQNHAHYYILTIHKFALTYAKVFEDLLEKENLL